MNDVGLNFMLGTMIAIAFLGLWSVVGIPHDNIYAFEERCEAKGGKTLRGYRRGHSWIGCYKVEELYNELPLEK